MDQRVLRAMAKWPDVPDVFGWLGLDVFGRWLLRGAPITNAAAKHFIGRNYLADDLGRWYFQNGPQRVYVELAYMPWVFSIFPDGMRNQAGKTPIVRAVLMDETGNLVFDTNLGPGSLTPRDLPDIAGRLRCVAGELDETRMNDTLARVAAGMQPGLALECFGRSLPVGHILSQHAPRRFGYVQRPKSP